jgi:hypothetical protein
MEAASPPENPSEEPETLNEQIPTKEEDKAETRTEATAEENPPETTPHIVVSSTKKTRPPYKYDPDKITLRFLFANRDGLTVTVECKPTDTVGEVKGALISVWPDGTFFSFSSYGCLHE